VHAPGRSAVSGLPLLWLLLFLLLPFLIVLRISFAEVRLAIPPYSPLFERLASGGWRLHLQLSNYRYLISDRLYLDSFLYSLKVAAISTAVCLLLGYPMAYGIARASTVTRNLLLMLVVLPFWTSFLLRVYAWIGMLKNNGIINNVLLATGLIKHPLAMMQTDFAVYVGIVYSYLPFMVLPLYANLEKHEPMLMEAAADLGSTPWTSFRRITVPLSLPGVVAGCLLVFIPAVGEYVIPSLLGPQNQLMIGRVLSDEFFSNRDWPVASAVAMVMLVVLLLPIVILQRRRARALTVRP
jgi:putrescine transport system permease protein